MMSCSLDGERQNKGDAANVSSIYALFSSEDDPHVCVESGFAVHGVRNLVSRSFLQTDHHGSTAHKIDTKPLRREWTCPEM